jgi:hypothetical protein
MGNLVIAGLGSSSIVVRGLGDDDGSAPTPTTDCIIELGNAEIFVGIQKSGGDWYLLYRDEAHDITTLLPTSAAQAAGTAWCFIRLRRVGSSLYIYLGKTLVSTIALTAIKTCGNDAVIMRGLDHTLHDLRVNSEAISVAAGDYCYDDILQNQGKSMLPAAA